MMRENWPTALQDWLAPLRSSRRDEGVWRRSTVLAVARRSSFAVAASQMVRQWPTVG
jgi:hypothetical protein